MRPAQDVSAAFPARSTGPAGSAAVVSATPIYDALYSEFRRSFRTLPGDRSGEEELGFRAFGTQRQQGLHAGWSAYALPPGRRGGI
ncbi:hypothetical protein ACIGO8_18785 [Streptomyces sp. NPDC053493]|uniref:hypothetical protein n=1 Tax=Streptomyces sp. NPDC053493 TaxID=3365705 RepID=UPI0037D9279B